MPRLNYSKAALQKQTTQLKRYRQFLPSLDLKRQQLLVERNKAAVKLAELEQAITDCTRFVNEQLPMLSAPIPDLTGLVSVTQAEVGTENIVGVTVPVLQTFTLHTQEYSPILPTALGRSSGGAT